MWAEQFCRCMPQLPSLVNFLFIQLVLEFGVAVSQLLVEFGFVFDLCEIEGFARGEDDGLFREVAIVRVV